METCFKKYATIRKGRPTSRKKRFGMSVVVVVNADRSVDNSSTGRELCFATSSSERGGLLALARVRI